LQGSKVICPWDLFPLVCRKPHLRLRCSFGELLLCVCHSWVHKKRSVDTTLFCDFICLKALVPSWKEAENASWGCRVLYTIQAHLPQMIFRSVFVESCPSFGAPFVACLDVDLAKRSNPCRIVGDLHVSFPHSTRKKAYCFGRYRFWLSAASNMVFRIQDEHAASLELFETENNDTSCADVS